MSSRNPYAWPPNWRADPRFENLYSTLCAHYGEERASRVVRGEDEPTNADLASWRGLGHHHGPARAV